MYKNSQARCIAHEIRNQISICELYSQIISKTLEKNGVKNDSVSNALSCISKSLKIMSNNLLDLKSLENSETKSVNAVDIVKEAINLSIVYVQEKDINISLSCIKNAQITVDENKFLACLINLIKNAIEAIEKKGEIKVEVNVIDEKLSIKITNNGPMIPIDIQKHLFEEGFTTKVLGSGLGLPICAENLKSQNAHLSLTNSTAEYTEFEILIPYDKIL